MNNKPFIILLCLYTILTCSCTNEPKTKPKPILVFVLCDVSNSTTKLTANDTSGGMLDSLKSYVRRIPKCYPLGSRILFYPISDNAKEHLIGEEISYQDVSNSKWEAQSLKMDSDINNICVQIDTLAAKCKNSCILNSIENTLSLVNDYKLNDKYKDFEYQLIIISDLVESCAETKICIDAFDIKKLRKSIDSFSKYKPRSNLGSAFQRVKIILNIPYLKDENAELIKNTWLEMLAKMNLRPGKNLEIYERVFTMQPLSVF